MTSATYYGAFIAELSDLAKMEGEGPRDLREDLYLMIRMKSGLGPEVFQDYGDDPERWITWMRANDTKDFEKAWKKRAQNERQRGFGI